MIPDFALLLVLFLVLWAEFVNGWTDAPNSIATVISTKVLSPSQAILMACILNTAGALSGTAVAITIGKGIVRPEAINLVTVGAGMLGIICWSTTAWYFGLPTSETHALVAGLAGATLATAGPSALLWAGWKKVLLGLVFSTFFGLIGGLIIMSAIYRFFGSSRPQTARRLFGRLQIFSAAFMAFSHGSNDGQKFIGVFALVLLLGGATSSFSVPIWVILLCAVAMGVGTAVGGWRIIRTLGLRLTKLDPVHGFAAETSAALTIQLSSFFGIPLSTTHTIGTAIMGVGAAKGLSAVRWGVGRNMVFAWILTFPFSFLFAWSVTKIVLLVV